MAIFQTVWDAIPQYTGLSSVTFFTLVAVLVAAYYLLTALFTPNLPAPVYVEPPPPPVQVGTLTKEQLAEYDGKDTSKPLLMSIRGNIYDVSNGRMFYGPGGPYELFAGKDPSKALAKMSFEPEDLTPDVSGLSAYELTQLDDWEYRFQGKYHKVGELAKENGDAAPAAPQEEAEKQPAESVTETRATE